MRALLLSLSCLIIYASSGWAAQYVVGWGDNSFGQISVPPGLTNATAVATMGQNSLALKSDGTVVAWGGFAPAIPPGASNVAAIACGPMHCVVLKRNGTVMAWGSNSFGQTNVPAGLSNVAAIAAGELHSTALLSNGIVVQWGNYTTPIPAGLTNVIAITARSHNTMALRNDGSITAWGDEFTSSNLPPIGLTNVIAIAGTSLALRSDTTPACWGDNSNGQTNVPAGLTNVASVSTSGDHNLVIKADGVPAGWGRNDYGQSVVPPALTNALFAAAGYNCSLVVVSADDNSPVVVVHPSSQTVDAGASPLLSASAEGSPRPDCQWQFNGDNIPGATNRTFYVSNAVPANAGGYRAVFSNPYGTGVTATAVLTVNAHPPTLSYPLQDQSALPGSTVTWALPFFTVPAGSPPMTYQWRFNGADIPAATNRQLVLPNIQSSNEGYYTLSVTNPYGRVDTTAFLDVVNLAEALNSTNLVWTTGGDAPWVVQNNYDITGYLSPVGASGVITNNQSSTLQTTVAGPARLTFWWKVSSQPVVDYLAWSLNGLEQARISGSSTPGSGGWQQQTVYLDAGTQNLRWAYSKGPSGSGGQDAGWLDHVSYTAGTFPPVITSQPASLNLVPGSNAVFGAQVTGAPPFAYQWQLNGSDISGAIDSTLTISNAQPTNNGSYHVLISNRYGSVLSSNATLNMFLFVGPAQPQDALDRWYFRSPLLLSRVRFTGGLFVGVGTNGLVATSPDGAVWTHRNSGTTANLAGVACGTVLSHNLFVAVGASGTVLTSGDGITWGAASATSQTLNDVAWKVNKFVATTTASAAGQPNVLYSFDGTNWTGASFANNPDTGLPFISSALDVSGNYFLTAGGSQFTYNIWRSSNGLTWTNVGYSDQTVEGIATGNGTSIMVGWEGWPRVSTNQGAGWFASASSVISSNAYQPPDYWTPMVGADIAFGNGNFLVARSWLQNGFLTTTDGMTWVGRNLFSGASVDSVAYGNGTFVAACSGGAFPAGIYQSGPSTVPIVVLACQTNQAVALSVSGEIGRSYRLQTSSDLTTWNDRLAYSNSTPLMQFVDPVAPGSTRLFYRVVSP